MATKSGNFAALFPQLSLEWHPTKNGAMRPEDFSPGSKQKVWWLGKCGHEFDAVIGKRASGSGCRYCSGHSALPGFNDLETKNPDLAKEWHPSKNGELKPSEVVAGSNRKVWWLGKCGHEFEAAIGSRLSGRGCKYCSGNEVLAGFNDLATLRPDIAAQWDWATNGDKTPDQFTTGSNTRVYWICDSGHSWLASINKRVLGQGCGVCRNLTFIPGVNDLATLRPDIAAQWDYSKNLERTPETVGPGSEIKVWWICDQGHSFDSTIDSRCRDGKGCRVCAGRELVVGFNDLATKYPALAKEWHPTLNGDLVPEEVLAGSPKDYFWLGECGHSWQSRITNRTHRNSGCPTCSAGGYDSASEGLIYFIENTQHGAFKIGITNPSAKNDRLQAFIKAGWEVIYTFRDGNGKKILNMETSLFKWLRKDLGIPIHLVNESMNGLSGSSETFSNQAISGEIVQQRIKALAEQSKGSKTR